MSEPPVSPLSATSPPEPPPAPPTSPTRKRLVESSSGEDDEKPSPSKVTRLTGPERLILPIRTLKVDNPPTTSMSDVRNKLEALAAETADEQAAEPVTQSKWLQALPHALKLISIQASLPEFQQVLEKVKTSIQTPEGATEFQKREDTKLAVLITRTLLDKFTETEKQITELREQAASLTKEDEEMEIDKPGTSSQGQVEDDNVSAEDLTAQVRSILVEASAALENARKVADGMVTSNDGGVRDALEWWKSLAENFLE
ncbi:hypothetical protein K449DRAFT_12201 [Hypoxylon sp. EC38]|nr:hypothetical protein K449DRAFT_12201 [Hypoxylon sp. EC38]